MLSISPAGPEGLSGLSRSETIRQHVDALLACIDNPMNGLPEEIFLFASSIVPMVNVDLLIRNDAGHTLLTWRDDRFSGAGWHIPGGIIRYKERISERIAKVAMAELSAELAPNPILLDVREFHIPGRRERAHFISFLYECRLNGKPDPERAHKGDDPVPGQWRWFEHAPDDLLSCHVVYKQYL